MSSERQRLAVLGSTGSIGEQTLDIVRRHPEIFEITTLTGNNNWELLARQAVEFQPDSVVIANREYLTRLKSVLEDFPIKVYAGSDSVCQVVEGSQVDTVVNALVGFAGLEPTLAALMAGKKLALANKESLVVAGGTVMKLAEQTRTPIIPVDSEHSAIFQCLAGEHSPVRKIILTASGGPFLDTPLEELDKVTVEDALDHPNWSMGAKITIDSATMINKCFEVIEARWLFDLKPEQIEVLVHPQSIVHSMVEFSDGAIKAQLGTADMHLPIQYALTFPYRIETGEPGLDFTTLRELNFRTPDVDKFPALKLAYECMKSGGDCCCTLNAANEVAVAEFLAGRIRFTDISRAIEYVLEKSPVSQCETIHQWRESNARARRLTTEFISSL